MRGSWLAVAALALALPARGDVLRLSNGEALEGKIEEDEPGKPVRIRLDRGTLDIPRASVAGIERGPTRRDQYEERRKALGPGAGPRYELGLWCRKLGLEEEAGREFQEAIRIDPGHVPSREALGHERVGGAWLDPVEAKRAKGFVLVDGKWLSPEEREREIERLSREIEGWKVRAEKAEADAEARRRELEETLGRMRAREADWLALRSEIDRLRAELSRPAIVVIQPAPCPYGIVHPPGHSCGRPGCGLPENAKGPGPPPPPVVHPPPTTTAP